MPMGRRGWRRRRPSRGRDVPIGASGDRPGGDVRHERSAPGKIAPRSSATAPKRAICAAVTSPVTEGLLAVAGGVWSRDAR
jgi:hypothetical protein